MYMMGLWVYERYWPSCSCAMPRRHHKSISEYRAGSTRNELRVRNNSANESSIVRNETRVLSMQIAQGLWRNIVRYRRSCSHIKIIRKRIKTHLLKQFYVSVL